MQKPFIGRSWINNRPAGREVHMFYKKNDSGFRPVAKGITRKTLAFGKNTLITEFRMEAGSVFPGNTHGEEQTGYLVSGAILLTIGEETFTVGPGDSWSIPGNVVHYAEILTDSVAVEVFSPVRSDYLPGGE